MKVLFELLLRDDSLFSKGVVSCRASGALEKLLGAPELSNYSFQYQLHVENISGSKLPPFLIQPSESLLKQQ